MGKTDKLLKQLVHKQTGVNPNVASVNGEPLVIPNLSGSKRNQDMVNTWLSINGDNANQNIDIGAYNLTATQYDLAGGANIYYSGNNLYIDNTNNSAEILIRQSRSTGTYRDNLLHLFEDEVWIYGIHALNGLNVDENLNFHTSTAFNDCQAQFRPSYTYDQFLFTVDSGVGRQIILCDYTYRAKDFDHATQTNPTFYVHSAENPDTDNTQYISFTHDQTDAIIDIGKGGLKLFTSDVDDYFNFYISGATGVFRGVGCPLYLYSDTGAISLVADGDTNDYIQVKCTDNVPEIYRVGGSVLHYKTDATNKTLRCYKDGTNFVDFGWEGTSDYGYWTSTGPFRLITNSDSSDYIEFSTTSNRTTLEFANQNGIISSNSGAGFVDFSTCDIVGKQKTSSGTTEFRIIGDTQTDHEVGMRMYAGSNYPVFFTEGNSGYFVIKGTSLGFMSNTEFGFYNDKIFRFGHGGSAHAGLLWDTTQTNACLYLGLSDYGAGNNARYMIIGDYADEAGDYAHGVQSNPTVFVHSNTAAATATDEWISLTHDVTDGRIEVGSGKIKSNADIESAGDVKGATLTAGNGHTGWFDDGANFRVTVTNGIITAIGNSVAGGWA